MEATGHKRLNNLLAALVSAVLLAGLWLVCCVKPAPGGGDLSMVFLGLTNDPGGSAYPQRLYLASDGRGWHALFAVTNITRNTYVNFGVAAIETLGREGWRTNEPGSLPKELRKELGHGFSPGYSYRFAIPCPAGLSNDTPWRLRLWVTRESRLFSVKLHHHGYGLRPYGGHSVTSDVVIPLSSAAAQPIARSGEAQPGAPANESQPFDSETNRTSPAAVSRR